MKKIVFVTGTRADYGKLKSIILKLQKIKNFKVSVFVTGMHNLKIYGSTHDELRKDKINLSKDFYVFTGSTVGVVPILAKGLYKGKIENLGSVNTIIR